MECQLCVRNEALQVRLGDSTNGVDVRTRAIVLRQIATQTASWGSDKETSFVSIRDSPLIHVCTSEHKQSTHFPADPWQKLREEIGKQHPQARLDVLQRQVLCVRPAMRPELRLLIRYEQEQLTNGVDADVHVQIDMVAEPHVEYQR